MVPLADLLGAAAANLLSPDHRLLAGQEVHPRHHGLAQGLGEGVFHRYEPRDLHLVGGVPSLRHHLLVFIG